MELSSPGVMPAAAMMYGCVVWLGASTQVESSYRNLPSCFNLWLPARKQKTWICVYAFSHVYGLFEVARAHLLILFWPTVSFKLLLNERWCKPSGTLMNLDDEEETKIMENLV